MKILPSCHCHYPGYGIKIPVFCLLCKLRMKIPFKYDAYICRMPLEIQYDRFYRNHSKIDPKETEFHQAVRAVLDQGLA